MYSLIITVVSLTLVVFLSLATIYYGGPVWAAQQANAAAAAVASQGAQLRAVLLLYGEEHASAAPTALTDLTPRYLRVLPTPPTALTAGSVHQVSNQDWALVGSIGIWLRDRVPAEVCDIFNMRLGRTYPGVPKFVDATQQAQCFHDPTTSEPNDNTVLVLTAASLEQICTYVEAQGVPCSRSGALPGTAEPAVSPPAPRCGATVSSGWYQPVCRNPVLFGQ